MALPKVSVVFSIENRMQLVVEVDYLIPDLVGLTFSYTLIARGNNYETSNQL